MLCNVLFGPIDVNPLIDRGRPTDGAALMMERLTGNETGQCRNRSSKAGAVTHLTGRVLDLSGSPIKDAVVEIWQVDNKGVYIHSADSGRRQRDTNFQGFGRFTTSAKGEYRFRTIKPVPYGGRTPHIHFKVRQGNRELLTSQIFVSGHEQNKSDAVLRGIRDLVERELVIADFIPVKESKIGELAAAFDIVIGRTPSDRNEERRRLFPDRSHPHNLCDSQAHAHVNPVHCDQYCAMAGDCCAVGQKLRK